MDSIKPKKNGIFRQWWNQNKSMILSHHPECNDFKDHTFQLGKQHLCIGCYIGYPSAIIGLLSGVFLIEQDYLHPRVAFNLSIVLMLFLILSLTNITNIKPIKFAQKICMGVGAGLFLAVSYIIYPASPTMKFFVVIGFTVLLLTPINVLHYIKHNRICERCEFTPGWGRCPGYPSDIELLKEEIQ